MPLTSIRVIASRRQACSLPHRAAGVGMIEVLVALIVLSVGMLAVIGMQITGKQAYADSVLRTSAAHLSSDLIERMRTTIGRADRAAFHVGHGGRKVEIDVVGSM